MERPCFQSREDLVSLGNSRYCKCLSLHVVLPLVFWHIDAMKIL